MFQPKLPPGPPPIHNPIRQIALGVQLSANPLNFIGDWFAQYGDAITLQVGESATAIFSRPEHLHAILVANAGSFHKDSQFNDPKRGLARMMGNGLLTSDGEYWKRQRKLVAPAFHMKRIAGYAEAMTHFTAQMLDRWQSGAVLDFTTEMHALTLQIVARTLFNMDVSQDIARVGHAVDALQRWSATPRLLPTWVPTRVETGMRVALRDLDAIIYGLIQARRGQDDDAGDVLSMLLAARDEDGSAMTDQQIRDEVVTLILAGHETTANTLNWTFYLLSENPQIEARLHAELYRVLAGRTPTLHDLEQLPYTEMVIKEAMRLYPPAWSTSRVAIEDVEIGEYRIPKGMDVGMVFYYTHRDPTAFPDPERFDPERFNAENEPNIPRYAYLPFGGGPRVCIGNTFAMMEARLLLAGIASRYALRLEAGHRVEKAPYITLMPKYGLRMWAQRREIATRQAESPMLEAVM